MWRIENDWKRAIPGFTIELVSPNDITKLVGKFSGFPDSPYDGGIYELEINIPQQYPHVPPLVRFVTKVWHPNISSVTGCICLDILSDKWTIQQNLLSVVIGIKSLLIQAEPDDPQDAQVAAQYRNNINLFDKTAAFWNYVYAGGEKSDEFTEFETKLGKLCEMGYDKNKSIHMLSMKNWDVDDCFRDLSGNWNYCFTNKLKWITKFYALLCHLKFQVIKPTFNLNK